MIDEVHMLTGHAFNAMLKTLEEPPEYLKFVLATTDPQKVPATVLSRCLQFNLRPMAPQTIVRAPRRGAARPKASPPTPAALRLIARAARGSMRDALSLTDQAIAYGSGALEEAGVRQMLGAVDRGHAVRLVEALARARRRGADRRRRRPARARPVGRRHARGDGRAAAGDGGAAGRAAARRRRRSRRRGRARLAALLPADETQLLYSIVLHGRAELRARARRIQRPGDGAAAHAGVRAGRGGARRRACRGRRPAPRRGAGSCATAPARGGAGGGGSLRARDAARRPPRAGAAAAAVGRRRRRRGTAAGADDAARPQPTATSPRDARRGRPLGRAGAPPGRGRQHRRDGARAGDAGRSASPSSTARASRSGGCASSARTCARRRCASKLQAALAEALRMPVRLELEAGAAVDTPADATPPSARQRQAEAEQDDPRRSAGAGPDGAVQDRADRSRLGQAVVNPRS